jgi:biotin operon repressor
MSQGNSLTPEQQEFIERVGLYFAQYHLSRIGGRLLGLLLLVDRPVGIEEMATLLGVSRASVSTNIRETADFGLTERVGIPGDRRDYYRFSEDAWHRGLEARIVGTLQLRRIAEQGLAALQGNDTTASNRLAELVDFCDFTIEEQRAAIVRWQERRDILHRAHPPPPQDAATDD